MNKNITDELHVKFKIAVIEYACVAGITQACREFEVSRSTFYVWKNKYNQHGKIALYRKKPIAKSHPRKTSPEVIEKYKSCVLNINLAH
jgi:transposase-like protein